MIMERGLSCGLIPSIADTRFPSKSNTLPEVCGDSSVGLNSTAAHDAQIVAAWPPAGIVSWVA